MLNLTNDVAFLSVRHPCLRDNFTSRAHPVCHLSDMVRTHGKNPSRWLLCLWPLPLLFVLDRLWQPEQKLAARSAHNHPSPDIASRIVQHIACCCIRPWCLDKNRNISDLASHWMPESSQLTALPPRSKHLNQERP